MRRVYFFFYLLPGQINIYTVLYLNVHFFKKYRIVDNQKYTFGNAAGF